MTHQFLIVHFYTFLFGRNDRKKSVVQIHHKDNFQFTTVCFKLVFFFMENNVYNFLLINTYLKMKEFEDTKGAIRIRISKKNRQHNGQKKKYKRTNNDLQSIHIKLKIE